MVNSGYLKSLLIQLLFIPLLGLAILFFKGGTIDDPTTVGYSFYGNFISELGAVTAHNGEFNSPSIFFFIGAILGIKVMSKFISILLHKYPKKILLFLLGLMIGSIHKIWPWQNKIDSTNYVTFKEKSIVLPNNYDGPPELFKAFLFMGLGSLIFFTLSRAKK